MELPYSCPVCFGGQASARQSGGWNSVSCPRCGDFKITFEAQANWIGVSKKLDERKLANASAWVRNHQGIAITTEDISALSNVFVPTVAGRAAILLEEIARRTGSLGQPCTSGTLSADSLDVIARTWSLNSAEVNFLAWQYLRDEKGFVVDADGTYKRAIVTPRGYAFLEERGRTNQLSNIGFCAMWFDASMLSAWTDAIEPAISSTGYEPKRIDSHEHNNKIDDEIVAMIRRSRFVVADFTGQRGGVYFEAGLAQGLGLPVVWTIRHDALSGVHFDTRQYNFVTWTAEDLPGFREKLRNRIEATIGRAPQPTS